MSLITTPVIMPQLGVNDREITIVEWIISPGAEVHASQVIAHIETTKATLDLHSETSGYCYPVIAAGTSVPIGETVALIVSERSENIVQAWKDQQRSLSASSHSSETFEATARARELIQQHNIDPAKLPQGRIIREKDVLALLPPAASPAAHVILSEAKDLSGSLAPGSAGERARVRGESSDDPLLRRVAIFGASQGGLAVLDCLRTMAGYEAVAFLDDASDLPSHYASLPVWPGSTLEQLRDRGIGAIATHLAKGSIRLALIGRCRAAGILPLNTVHARAIVASNVRMGEGNLIKAGAVLDTEVQLSDACIIDNGAIVPHHNRIGNACHLAPGATLGGDCEIGDYTVVGIGAVISARLKIGRNVLISAGAAVLRDLPDNVVVEGNPARIIGERK